MLQKIANFIETHPRLFGWPLIILFSFFAFALAIFEPDFLNQVEMQTLDQRFKMRGPLPADQRIVLVAVDNESISSVGRWPWSRERMAAIVERVMGQYGAKVMGFDMVFSEPQRNPVVQTRELLETSGNNGEAKEWLLRHEQLGDVDNMFSQTLAKYRDRLVLGYFFYPERSELPASARQRMAENARLLQPSVMSMRMEGDAIAGLLKIGAIEGNLPLLTQSTDLSGFFNNIPDSDGMVRRVQLMAEYDGNLYPSLMLQTLRVALGWPQVSAEVGEAGAQALTIGDHRLQLSFDGKMLVNHYGPGRSFTHVSAADVLSGKADPAIFKDAIVLFGVTAMAVFDYRPTPFDEVFPGTEVIATGMANILNDAEIQRPAWLEVSELLAVLLLSLACGFAVYRRGPMVQILSIVGVPVIIVILSGWLFVHYHIWLKVTYLVLGVLLATLPSTLLEYIVESRKRVFIHDAFAHYLAPKVVEALAKNPEQLRLGGEERYMTAIFSDIAGFSSFSEKLTPAELVHFLNLYLSEMSNIILDLGGTIDKYEGDAIVAFFGAPMPMDDHATQAVISAMQQQEMLDRMRGKWIEKGLPAVHVRIGLNSGPMVVGNMGTERRMNYTIMGDNVNLASRLEGVCKVYKVSILISRETYDQVRERIAARFIDRVRVVGRSTPVDIYFPLGERGKVDETTIYLSRQYEKAWTLMQSQGFRDAMTILIRLTAEFPEDGPSAVMKARVEEFLKNPPPHNWDGVHSLSSK